MGKQLGSKGHYTYQPTPQTNSNNYCRQLTFLLEYVFFLSHKGAIIPFYFHKMQSSIMSFKPKRAISIFHFSVLLCIRVNVSIYLYVFLYHVSNNYIEWYT